MSYQLNPLMEGSAYKKYLIDHPEVIKKEVDPIKKALMRKIRHQTIVGKKVSKQISKGPHYYVTYLPGGDKVKHQVISGESEMSKWLRLPRPWARSNEWKDNSVVTRAIGRAHEGIGGKYHKGYRAFDPVFAKEVKKQKAMDSGNLDRIISTREPGDVIRKWRSEHPAETSYF